MRRAPLYRDPNCVVRVVGPFHDQGTSWDYDPMPTLRQAAAPQLWILAAKDREAPHEETLRRLTQLQREGRPIVTAVFPDTDHGILEFEDRDGERVYTRYAEGYYPMMIEWIRGFLNSVRRGKSLRNAAPTPLVE